MAKETQGVIFYWATSTTPSTAISIGEVNSFSGPGMSNTVIDVTHLQSTAKEKMIGLYDAGQVTLSVNAVVTDAGQTKLRECLAARTKGHCQIQLSTAATTQKIAFEAYCNGLSVSGGVDNVLKSDITLLLAGGATFTT